jgi:hypothetical protein
MYAVGTAVSFIDARIALIIYAGMALYQMAPQSTLNSGQH